LQTHQTFPQCAYTLKMRKSRVVWRPLFGDSKKNPQGAGLPVMSWQSRAREWLAHFEGALTTEELLFFFLRGSQPRADGVNKSSLVSDSIRVSPRLVESLPPIEAALDTKQAALALEVRPQTLRVWRQSWKRGKPRGPRFLVYDKRTVRYEPRDIRQYKIDSGSDRSLSNVLTHPGDERKRSSGTSHSSPKKKPGSEVE
jgi:hypothetical protein